MALLFPNVPSFRAILLDSLFYLQRIKPMLMLCPMHVPHTSNGSTAQLAAGAQIPAFSSISPAAVPTGGFFAPGTPGVFPTFRPTLTELLPPSTELRRTLTELPPQWKVLRPTSKEPLPAVQSTPSTFHGTPARLDGTRWKPHQAPSDIHGTPSNSDGTSSSLHRTPISLKATHTTPHLTHSSLWPNDTSYPTATPAKP